MQNMYLNTAVKNKRILRHCYVFHLSNTMFDVITEYLIQFNCNKSVKFPFYIHLMKWSTLKNTILFPVQCSFELECLFSTACGQQFLEFYSRIIFLQQVPIRRLLSLYFANWLCFAGFPVSFFFFNNYQMLNFLSVDIYIGI